MSLLRKLQFVLNLITEQKIIFQNKGDSNSFEKYLESTETPISSKNKAISELNTAANKTEETDRTAQKYLLPEFKEDLDAAKIGFNNQCHAIKGDLENGFNEIAFRQELNTNNLDVNEANAVAGNLLINPNTYDHYQFDKNSPNYLFGNLPESGLLVSDYNPQNETEKLQATKEIFEVLPRANDDGLKSYQLILPTNYGSKALTVRWKPNRKDYPYAEGQFLRIEEYSLASAMPPVIPPGTIIKEIPKKEEPQTVAPEEKNIASTTLEKSSEEQIINQSKTVTAGMLNKYDPEKPEAIPAEFEETTTIIAEDLMTMPETIGKQTSPEVTTEPQIEKNIEKPLTYLYLIEINRNLETVIAKQKLPKESRELGTEIDEQIIPQDEPIKTITPLANHNPAEPAKFVPATLTNELIANIKSPEKIKETNKIISFFIKMLTAVQKQIKEKKVILPTSTKLPKETSTAKQTLPIEQQPAIEKQPSAETISEEDLLASVEQTAVVSEKEILTETESEVIIARTINNLQILKSQIMEMA